MSERPTPIEAGFVGLWGHSKYSNGSLEWQFSVLRKVDESHHAIQLYSWADGAPTCVKIVSNKDLIHRFVLYATNDDMQGAFETWPGKYAEQEPRT